MNKGYWFIDILVTILAILAGVVLYFGYPMIWWVIDFGFPFLQYSLPADFWSIASIALLKILFFIAIIGWVCLTVKYLWTIGKSIFFFMGGKQ